MLSLWFMKLLSPAMVGSICISTARMIFESVLSELRECASDFDDVTVEIVETPPTNATRVTKHSDGKFFVDLVYSCELYVQGIEYLACWVYNDGRLELQEIHTFIKGPPGSPLSDMNNGRDS